MKNRLRSLILCSLFILSTVVLAESDQNPNKLSEEYNNDIRQLKQEVKFYAEGLEILRRDQINYRMEKDLLKETYSSNLQTINLLITIILGGFTVVGFLGLRSMSAIKSEYSSELNQLKTLKNQFENELKELVKQQEKFQSQVEEITKSDEDQNKRIKLLEIIEKAISYANMKNWDWALEWVAEGLKLDPNNLVLLDTKRHCLWQIEDYKESIKISRLIVEMNQSNRIGPVLNLLESLALMKESNEFEVVFQKYKAEIEKDENNNLIMTYLHVLQNIVNDDITKAKTILSEFIPDLSGIEADSYFYFFDKIWSIDVAQAFKSKLTTEQQKQYLQTLNNFFTGKLSAKQLKEFLSKN